MCSQIAVAIIVAVYASCSVPVSGDVFLEKNGGARLPAQAPPILEELERVLGREHRIAAEARVERLEEVIRPTFLAMPKNSDGGLSPDGVRYVLHRVFVDRHGWFVKGLDSAGDAWNSSSPAAMFKGHDGGEAHAFFSDRLANHSFNLHHTAVLAATLETFVHTETLDRLHAAYRLLGLSRHENSGDEEETALAIETYLMLYVLGSNHSEVDVDKLEEYRKTILEVYPTWEATTSWARGVRREVLDGEDKPQAAAFDTTVRVLEEVGDRYGRWQDTECRDLKASLLKMEYSNSGRVLLGSFYASALDGNWQFSETVDYLRQLGALDESDSSHASVIIPNYINSPSNCVASSKFYSVCCIDECESLLGHLETHIAAPEASVARIVELVSGLSSPTVQAPRKLPAQLVKRLEEIASQHNGQVTLHSRLFSQWMHHAFPRECSYPHVTGTTKPLTLDAWIEQTGGEMAADAETMRWHADEARKITQRKKMSNEDESELPWSEAEELLVHPAFADGGDRASSTTSSSSSGRGLAFIAAVCSVSLVLMKTFMKINDAVPSLVSDQQQKLFV